jgi:hypothetical protein
LAAACVPTMPPAAGRLSTTKRWPTEVLMRSSTMRAMTSLALPEENGTMTVTGRTG